jgi:hypothetical protein
MLTKIKSAIRVFRELGHVEVDWTPEHQNAAQQFFTSPAGKRLLLVLQNCATRKDTQAVFAGGGRFEAGKAVGMREALTILEYLVKIEVEEFTENSEGGAVAELLESLRP